jgi:hypothetical protein
MTESGEELDMIVGGDVQDFAHEEDLPLGVIDLTILNKNTIRVTYHPKIVGARDLLSNPFFQSAKLAPLQLFPDRFGQSSCPHDVRDDAFVSSIDYTRPYFSLGSARSMKFFMEQFHWGLLQSFRPLLLDPLYRRSQGSHFLTNDRDGSSHRSEYHYGMGLFGYRICLSSSRKTVVDWRILRN